MSSMSVTDLSQTQTDVFKKSIATPTTIRLSQEKIDGIHAGEEPAPATTDLSPEAIEKAQKEVLQTRNNIIELNKSKTNAVINDVDTFFSGMLSQASVSSLDMGGLISEALQSPDGAGNATTSAMDLSMTQAKLNALVEKFVPAEHQAASYAEIDHYVSKKASDQDALLKETTNSSLAIASQQGDMAGVEKYQQQLNLLESGQHATQIERQAMLDLTNSTTDSSAWFSGLRQSVNASADTGFFKDLATAHIAKLEAQWQKFTHLTSNAAA